MLQAASPATAACWARCGRLPVTSTPLQEILFSGSGCAVVTSWGGVSRAEKEYFTEGVEMHLPNPFGLPRAALGPCGCSPQKETLCHPCPCTLGRSIPVCLAMFRLSGWDQPLLQNKHQAHRQSCLVLGSWQGKLSLALSSALLALL